LDKIVADSIGKNFGQYMIFKDMSFEVGRGGSICLWGPNGSGKSTLLKILCGLSRASKGEITYHLNNKKGKPFLFKNQIGVTAPDVRLYDELSPCENLQFLSSARGVKQDSQYESMLIDEFGLTEQKDWPIGKFSSGMKQKFHVISSLAHKPSVVFLDEPTSFMDENGKKAVEKTIASIKAVSIIVIATNDSMERAWCEETVELRK